MSAYEFADEVGLKLLDAYPVKRDGRKVYVKTGELTWREITDIQRECTKVHRAMLDLMDKANKKVLAELESKMTPREWEDELATSQHKVRGRWRTWGELAPAEQAKLRERQAARIARHVDPEPEQGRKSRLRSKVCEE